MRTQRAWWIALWLLLCLMVAGVVSAQEGGDVERGGELFVENCAVCHGVDGQGRIGASLEDFPGIDPGAAMRQTIAAGVAGSVMPAWSEDQGGPLSDQDIDDIVAYISQAIGGTEPIEPLPTYVPPAIEPMPNIEGDPQHGAIVYQLNCVMCHGEEGRGRFGAPLAKAWPGVEPPAYIYEVVSSGISGSTMPAWSLETGGPLTPGEIEDVTAYVLSLTPATAQATPAAVPEGPLSMTTSLVVLGILVVLGVITLALYYRRA